MTSERVGVLSWIYASGPLLLCVAVLGWSGNFVVGRLVGGQVPPVQLALARWVIAGAILLPFAWRHLRADARRLRRHWRVLTVLSVTGVAVFNTLVYRGLETTTAVNGLLLQSVCPVLIIVVTALLHREPPRAVQLVGLVVSLAGVWLVITRGEPFGGLGLRVTVGDLWILLAVASYAVYTVALRSRPPVHPLSLLVVTFGAGALVLLPFAAVEVAGGRTIPLTPGALGAVAYVAVIPSIVSYACFNRGVELIGGARAGQFLHLMPVFGAVLAFVFVGERLWWFHLVGAAIIAAGLWLSGRSGRRVRSATDGKPA